MISLLIYLLVVCLVVGLIYYVVDALPVPAPLNKIVKIVAMVVGVLIVILALLQIAGVDTGMPLRRL
jgi:hypothetical protein